jgi:hypothetical protein
VVDVLLSALDSPRPDARTGVLEDFGRTADAAPLWDAVGRLHDRAFAAGASPYLKVRALLQAAALCRYYLPARLAGGEAGRVPHDVVQLVRDTRYVDALNRVRGLCAGGRLPDDALASVLAAAYAGHGFQVLALQVQTCVRMVDGNRWMFRLGAAGEYALRLRPELLVADTATGLFPVLQESTPVRMDLSHSGWSDIFFLGMDYPEGARVLNLSVDLGVHGRDPEPRPPIQTWLRVIDEPVIRLSCLDLGAESVNTTFADMFDYARDYTGLVKAAVVASGLVPLGMEGNRGSLAEILEPLVGPGRGLEVVSQVNDIPKGSRLAVSTNLLAGLITLCMRATGQVDALTGGLDEAEARIVVGRAVLGEWLGGSGGGWQDSGGIWPGIKVIQGEAARPGDPEYGQSNGRLLPRHRVLGLADVPASSRQALQDSLVVVHGGMAANVGPILEMVTEKHLLGDRRSWNARQELLGSFDVILDALKRGDIRALGELTTGLFQGPLQDIIPWVSNHFTQRLIAETRARFGDDFWGFWMLGGMSGGGMGFIFAPSQKDEAKAWLGVTMKAIKDDLKAALPFAMDPVVYDFAINDRGTWAELGAPGTGVPSPRYCLQHLREWVTRGDSLAPAQRHELALFSQRWVGDPQSGAKVAAEVLARLLPSVASEGESDLDAVLERAGFDPVAHETIRTALRSGTIGLAQNRLPPATTIEDARPGDVTVRASLADTYRAAGEKALAEGRVMVLTLAGGAGTRWTQGAGTVKALHPFARLGGQYRNFLEVHRAKARKAARDFGAAPLHVVTTSELTLPAVGPVVQGWNDAEPDLPIWVSPGRSIGLRMVPMVRDLKFLWEEGAQQRLEERKQKVLDSGRRALRDWAQSVGEGSDYRDNLASQCVHPVGHWYELANLFLNGTLARALEVRPGLEWILLHNLDTLGVVLDPVLLGHAQATGRDFSWEVITRRLEDHGGGLARVDGRLRLVEGMAFPREEDESRLSYYNSATCWIKIEPLLKLFGVTRADLGDPQRVVEGVRALAARMPTYLTIKDVKRRWGHGQEDVFPLSQWEKLFGDMSALPDLATGFYLVDRVRGQQLKDPAQLDPWVRDGSRDAIEGLCYFRQ